jgi:hypothetical protein
MVHINGGIYDTIKIFDLFCCLIWTFYNILFYFIKNIKSIKSIKSPKLNSKIINFFIN